MVEVFSGQGKDPAAKWKLCGGPSAIHKVSSGPLVRLSVFFYFFLFRSLQSHCYTQWLISQTSARGPCGQQELVQSNAVQGKVMITTELR